jgi:hypothetical protein
MDDEEKRMFRGIFPNLDVDRAVVTGELTDVYNCISWTVGVTGAWHWPPGPTFAEFDDFYRGYGFVRARSGTVAVWGTSPYNVTHGAVAGPGHGQRWESKYGVSIRFQHGLTELDGSGLGRVLAFYRKSRTSPAPYEALREDAVERGAKSYLSPAQTRALARAREGIPSELRSEFDRAFAAWKSTWSAGALAVSSDPHTRTVGREYDALIALGPTILPLVVGQLADPDNFLALQLYDAIQPNEKLLVQYDGGDDRIVEGEQGRARRTVQAWFTNQ